MAETMHGWSCEHMAFSTAREIEDTENETSAWRLVPERPIGDQMCGAVSYTEGPPMVNDRVQVRIFVRDGIDTLKVRYTVAAPEARNAPELVALKFTREVAERLWR